MIQRSLEPLTTMVTVMVVIMTGISASIQLWAAIHLESLQTYMGPIATQFYYGTFAFSIVTMIVFSVWIYRAGSNLIDAGFDDLEFKPGARIWWFAVPIANFFMPYQGMRELWNASHGNAHYADHNNLVSLWWALWLANSIASTLFQLFSAPDGPSPFVAWSLVALEIASAATALVMIRRIAAAQRRLSPEELSDVFA